MDLVAVALLEAAFLKVFFGGGGQQVELAQAARGQPVDELAHETAAKSLAAVRRRDSDRPDQRDAGIRFGAAAAGDCLSIAGDDECAPVVVDASDRKLICFQD